jgi:undecaprenyl pyrophosphate phosphatase UppP
VERSEMSTFDIISYVWLGILAIGIITLIVRGIINFDFSQVTWGEIKEAGKGLWNGLKVFLVCCLPMLFVGIMAESFGHCIYEWKMIWAVTITGGIVVMFAYYMSPKGEEKEGG